MTKFICSGLRVAYLVVPVHVQSKIEQAIFNINVKTSGLDVEVITQILHSNEANRILETKLSLTKRANQLFDSLFKVENQRIVSLTIEFFQLILRLTLR